MTIGEIFCGTSDLRVFFGHKTKMKGNAEMIVSALAAALVVVGPMTVGNAPDADPAIERTEAGYAELSAGQAEAAIARIMSSRQAGAEVANPAALINLAVAHARLGRQDEARRLLEASARAERFDLQLADGSWMDSRRASRIAMNRLAGSRVLASR